MTGKNSFYTTANISFDGLLLTFFILYLVNDIDQLIYHQLP